MSRFRSAIRAIRGPFDFATQHGPEDLKRAPKLRQTLLAALELPSALDIPPTAKRRIETAAQCIEKQVWPPDAQDPVLRRIVSLLHDDFPLQVLSQPTERIPGIGPKIAAALARKEIHTIEDLLLFLPRSYEDRRELIPIAALQVGHPACFQGTVTRADVVPLRSGQRFFQVVVADATGAVQLKWFRGISHFQDRVRPGVRLLVAGDVRRYRYAKELHHPEIELLSHDTPVESLPRIVPAYSAVEGIPPRTLRRLIESALRYASDLVDAYLPEETVRKLDLPEVGESLRQVHLPSVDLDPAELRARRTRYHVRLVAEELFLLQAGLELRRAAQIRRATKPLAVEHPSVRRAIAGLPFELTADQARVWSEIAADLARPHPMNRLLIGDVGTGKTVLAVLGAVAAHASGGFFNDTATTEILAEQHFETLRTLASPLGLSVALLTGSTRPPERRSLMRSLMLGEVAVVVGTHALLSGSVDLPRLRFVVIDEQHRFGVAQRRELGQKGDHPHVLVMTATPIPRTLALTLFGDLDHSVLRERPPGRAPVETRVVPPTTGQLVLREVRRTLERGEQVYVVYPLVEESEKQDLKDATQGFERLQRALPEACVALLHGRLDAGERIRVMERFAKGLIQVLVSTTVIEVGVDVHNATLLVVQHDERFGLAQLHQLRGRVGRGKRRGLAILMGDPQTEEAGRRLAILEASQSGFDIAEEDLRIRGAGEWLGTRQAGHLPELRLADLVRHGDLLPVVRDAAVRLLAHDPGLREHRELRAGIERRWGRRLDFSGVA
jgi:ATP-dependent DNA helicase RecG